VVVQFVLDAIVDQREIPRFAWAFFDEVGLRSG